MVEIYVLFVIVIKFIIQIMIIITFTNDIVPQYWPDNIEIDSKSYLIVSFYCLKVSKKYKYKKFKYNLLILICIYAFHVFMLSYDTIWTWLILQTQMQSVETTMHVRIQRVHKVTNF